MDEYLSDVSDPIALLEGFLDICGDVLFIHPALKVTRYHRDSGPPVFFYEYQHRPSLFDGIKPDFVKADHGDELIYVFGGPFLRDGVVFAGNSTDEEKVLSRTIMRYWANFAGHGLVEGNPHTRRRVMESGNLSSLIHLLRRSKSQRTQEAVARAVWTLAGDEMEAQRMVAGRIGADQMTSQRYNSPMYNFLMPDSAKPALYTIQNHNYYQLHL